MQTDKEDTSVLGMFKPTSDSATTGGQQRIVNNFVNLVTEGLEDS